MPKFICKKDILPLALGCSYLGSGGGGDVDIMLLLLEQMFEERNNQPLPIYSLDELDEKARIIPVGYVGAPFVAIERLTSGKEWEAIIPYYELDHAYFIPTEIGGSNGLTAIYTALCLNRPICDADTLGRAFPTVDICSLHMRGISVLPAVITDDYGRTYTVKNVDSIAEFESIVREKTVTMGSSSALSLRPLHLDEARHGLISGTVSLGLEIGLSILSSSSIESLEKTLSHSVSSHFIGTGVVTDIISETINGFSIGQISVGMSDGKNLILSFQNEFLVITNDRKEVLAESPDIITCLNHTTKYPVPCEKIKWGQKVDIFTSSSPDIWKEPNALPLVSAQRFNLTI